MGLINRLKRVEERLPRPPKPRALNPELEGLSGEELRKKAQEKIRENLGILWKHLDWENLGPEDRAVG